MTFRTRVAVVLPRLLLITAMVVMLMPIGMVCVIALTGTRQFAQNGLGLPDPWTMDNVADVIADPRTILIPGAVTAAAVGVVCVAQTASSIAAAFAFIRFQFPARHLIFAVIIGAWLVPPIVTVLPLYLAIVRLGLGGTFLALVVPSALASPYAVFLLTQWFAGIPASLLDAATLDGAGDWTILRRIVLPLSWPAIATVTLVVAVTTWNAYLWPRVIAGVRLPQIQVAIGALQTQFDANWTLVLAASALALLPPLALTAALSHPLRRTIDIHSEQ